ncbi:hypothetical protein J7E73_30025 [Paenibacillus albidus]|nr:hypothetical protein [Paenibacillus albidus]
MQMIDIVRMVMYGAAVSCSGYIIFCHRNYFYERFQKGVVSVFMLAMLFFLTAYTVHMLLVLLVELAKLLGAELPELNFWLQYAWAFAQLGTTGGLIVLALLTRSGTYDQFIHFERKNPKEEQDAHTGSGEK